MLLRYGCNPHQSYAAAEPLASPPCELVNGKPSLINLLDALNAWQLVSELRQALELPAAASFKHVSPAGAAVAEQLAPELAEAYEVAGVELTPAALAYVRARGADPKCSFGDFAALSEPVDEATANLLKGVISDGIIAPSYEPKALEILKQKKNGTFLVLRADPSFSAPQRESREVYGMRLTQDRNNRVFVLDDLADVVCGELTLEAQRDLVLGLTTLKYTQSNSVGYAVAGQMIGIGAGQQSRVDCTKLAGSKADVWQLRCHPKVLGLRFIEGDLVAGEQAALEQALETPASPLTAEERREFLSNVSGVSLVSDGFIPFRDNIDHAQRHGVSFVAQPGGSTRDAEVTAACQQYGMAMVHTHIRAFHH
jgi:phosphoribosylaminoimidazolecarboxamide formyltransferase/IMP cyclohydrolase